jgi:hypothetical protein
MLFVHREQWYAVRKPAEIRQRVELITDEPTLLFISAKRIERKPVFAQWPQQSDYVATWEEGKTASIASSKKSFKELVLKTSSLAKKFQTEWRRYKNSRKCKPTNRVCFVPVNLDEK